MLHTIEEVNAMDYEQFCVVFANVVEHCPIFAAAVWSLRPFNSLEDLHNKLCNFLDDLPAIGKLGILRLHPDLAGQIAKLGQLSEESKQEQLGAGMITLSEDEGKIMNELNQRYKTKFGFPFVICVRENKKDAILQGLKIRVENPPDSEIKTGVEEVKKIVMYRLMNLISQTA